MGFAWMVICLIRTSVNGRRAFSLTGIFSRSSSVSNPPMSLEWCLNSTLLWHMVSRNPFPLDKPKFWLKYFSTMMTTMVKTLTSWWWWLCWWWWWCWQVNGDDDLFKFLTIILLTIPLADWPCSMCGPALPWLTSSWQPLSITPLLPLNHLMSTDFLCFHWEACKTQTYINLSWIGKCLVQSWTG